MSPPVAATEYPYSGDLHSNSFDGDKLSLCSSDHHVPPFLPTAGLYPSPYRVSTAAAFADINRALDVRSLRNSVHATFEAGQTPLSLSSHRTNSSSSRNQAPLPDHMGRIRSYSRPDYPRRVTSSETESEHLFDDDNSTKCAAQIRRTVCVVPGGDTAVAGGQTKYFLSRSREKWIPRRKDVHKSAGTRAMDFVITAPNGKRSSKKMRGTDCVIM